MSRSGRHSLTGSWRQPLSLFNWRLQFADPGLRPALRSTLVSDRQWAFRHRGRICGLFQWERCVRTWKNVPGSVGMSPRVPMAGGTRSGPRIPVPNGTGKWICIPLLTGCCHQGAYWSRLQWFARSRKRATLNKKVLSTPDLGCRRRASAEKWRMAFFRSRNFNRNSHFHGNL